MGNAPSGEDDDAGRKSPAYVALDQAFTIAESKGQLFSSGSFFIQDRESALFNALYHCGPYARISTHLKGGVFEEQPAQWGVDIVPMTIRLQVGDHSVETTYLTILFAGFTLNGRTMLFMKPEKHGTKGILSKIMHSKTYIQTRFKSAKSKQSRKEHVPEAFKDHFVQLASRRSKTVASLNHYTTITEQGVGAMLSYLERSHPMAGTGGGDPLDLAAANVFKTFIADSLGTEAQNEQNFKYRIGEEVFISQAETDQIILRIKEQSKRKTASSLRRPCQRESALDPPRASNTLHRENSAVRGARMLALQTALNRDRASIEHGKDAVAHLRNVNASEDGAAGERGMFDDVMDEILVTPGMETPKTWL